MVYTSHAYGSYKAEIKNLLRRRLKVRARIRHHEAKIAKFRQDEARIEADVAELEARARGEVVVKP